MSMTSPDSLSMPGERLLQAAAFHAGVRQFNAGQYHECHETLEALWLQLRAGQPLAAAETLFVQGLIQLAVALYKWRQGNRRGALFLRERALFKWAALPAQFAGVNLVALRSAVERCFAPLAQADRPPPPAFPAGQPLAIAVNGAQP